MNARLTTLLAAIAAIGIIAVGCGGDDEGSSPASASGGSLPTSSLDKEEFLKRANAACEKRQNKILAEMNAYVEKRGQVGVGGPQVFVPLVKQVIAPAFEAQLAAVRALGAPEGEEGELEAALAAQEAAIEELKKQKGTDSLDDFEKPFLGATQKLKAYGLTACVNSA